MTSIKPDTTNRCIIAIGGSAGSLESLEHLLQNFPKDFDASIVIIQHMSPTHKSLLPELLEKYSTLPVMTAIDGQNLESPSIYVIEPGKILTLDNNQFRSRDIASADERRHPIDIFMSSLASNNLGQSIGIILSGTGSDGTEGLQSIKDSGGRTLVQNPADAKFDGMPQSAIIRGLADYVVSAKDMGKTLAMLSMKKNAERYNSIDKVCEILLNKTGHNFLLYKKSTVARRIERRIQANQFSEISEYIELLEKDYPESQALLKDLLISVTQFFRDPEVFTVLKQSAFPKLFSRTSKENLRLWVPACATGEEAYTIAILLKEHERETGLHLPIQIFATDIDRIALDTARLGHYPHTILEHVPAEYISRYFKKTEQGFQVNQELREICIFSEHSLLKNPPFSKIDFISCRNLFIYWEPELQQKTLSIFHYALNPGGILVLGPAENVSATSDLFRVFDKKNRIFQRNEVISSNNAHFPLNQLITRSKDTAEKFSGFHPMNDKDVTKSIVTSLLEDFAPPAFVVTEHGEIVFFSGRTGKFLEPPTGAPSNSIFEIIRKSIRPELHALIHKCVKSKAEITHPAITFEHEGVIQRIKLIVRPLQGLPAEQDLYLVILQEVMNALSKEEALKEGITLSTTDAIVHQLEGELRDTREHLQSTIEEVKSSNEELLSMNEELQSANEEMHTSKEELQSTNEELETVNAELSKKVEELDASNNDLQNFFNSAHVPIIFLDLNCRIQRYTPAARKIFRLINTDIGRGISDITSYLDYSDYLNVFNSVLETLQPVEKELSSKDGQATFIMRVSPYRTLNNVIDGVIATFSDVTELKNAQAIKSTMAAIVEYSSDAIIAKDLAGRITSWNEGAEKLFLYGASEAIGSSVTMLIPDEKLEEYHRITAKVLQGELVQNIDTLRFRKDGVRIHVSITMSPIKDNNGNYLGLSVILRDISEKVLNADIIAKSHEQILNVLESMGDAFFSLDADWKFTQVNSNQERVSQTKREDTIGRVFWDVFPTARDALYWEKYHEVMKNRVSVHFLERYAPLDLWTEVDAYPTKDGGIAVFFRDVTDKKKAEKKIQEANLQFRNMADAIANLAWIAQADGYITWYNKRWYEYTGTTEEDMEGWGWKSVHDPDELPRVLENWTESIKTGMPFEMTFPLKGADGKFRWFLTRGTPLKNTEGEVVTWFGTNTDIDDEKNITKSLEIAVQTRDEFLSIASHELKTPLTTMKIQAQMRRRKISKGDLTPFSIERLDSIFKEDERQVDRLTRLIDDMLDIARINSGKLTIHTEPMDLSMLVRKMTDRFSDQIQAQNCELTLDIPPAATGNWDMFRMEQVLMNLISNAMRYGAGGPILVKIAETSDSYILSIEDKGMGIAKEDHERIFQRFERAVDRNEVSGMGLGLYIVKQILDSHGARIWVESEKGHGAKFSISLPKTK